jgi:hypothetical protein
MKRQMRLIALLVKWDDVSPKEDTMGKAANNERIKLRATFYNNASVALWVGGAIIPYLALMRVFEPPMNALIHWQFPPSAIDNMPTFVLSAIGISVASFMARRCSAWANEEILKIQD